MAPKGGGSRSSSGSSRSGGGSRSSSSSSLWLRKSTLGGTHWTDGSAVAMVVFAILFFLILFGIRFWSSRVKKQHLHTHIRTTVLNKAWGTALWSGLFFYLWLVIERVLHEEQVVVANIYYIFEFILLCSGYIQEISLLLVTYVLIHQSLIYNNGTAPTASKGKKMLHYVNLGVVAILAIIFLVYFALGIKYIVNIYSRYGSSLNVSYYAYRTYDYERVQVAYQALYFVATIEVLALSILALVTKSKRGVSGTAMAFLLGLVAFPSVIRSVFLLAYTAGYSLGQLSISAAAYAAEDFIIGAAQMIIYIGIILTVGAIAKTSPSVPGAPLAAPPAMAQQPDGGAPQGQQAPYYPQQAYYAPQAPVQNGHDPKAFNAGPPPPQQAYYPPPQQNGYPQQNGVPPQGYPAYQQQYSPPPQQQYQAPPHQPAPAGQTGPSPVSNPTPPHAAHPQPQQSQHEMPSTHY